MNRQEEVDSIIRLVHDMADDHVLKECIGKAFDLAYSEGYRQCKEDAAFALSSQHQQGE